MGICGCETSRKRISKREEKKEIKEDKKEYNKKVKIIDKDGIYEKKEDKREVKGKEEKNDEQQDRNQEKKEGNKLKNRLIKKKIKANEGGNKPLSNITQGSSFLEKRDFISKMLSKNGIPGKPLSKKEEEVKIEQENIDGKATNIINNIQLGKVTKKKPKKRIFNENV